MTDRELPDWINSFVQFTDNSEPPEMFRIWTAISCVAAVLQRKCSLPWGSLTFYPNMYIVLVAPSGKARKGTAMGPGQKFLRDLDIKMTAEAITREALIRELSESTEQAVGTDGPEYHSSLTIFSKELTVFLGHQNHQLMSDLTDWFDCDDLWTYRTKTQGTDQVIGVWVNLIGATTPSLIESAMSLEAIGGGLTSRMIFVFEPKRGKSVALPIMTQAERDLYQVLLQDLERIFLMHGNFSVDESFIGPWVNWYEAQNENPPFNDPRFAGYFERRAMHCLKLSMILNASRSDQMVLTDEDFFRSVNLLEQTELKMPRTFAGVGRGPNSEVMAQIMAEMAITKECSFGDLMNRFYYDVDKFTLTKIIETLESMNFVRRVNKNGSVMVVYCRED